MRRDGEAIGTVMLQWSDEEIWGTMADDAGYVHGLRIRRRAAGLGLGRALLRWAEPRAVAAGPPCVSTATPPFQHSAPTTSVWAWLIAATCGCHTGRPCRYEKQIVEGK